MKNNSILMFDGAFGTYYSTLKHSAYECEYANLYDFETVADIHRQYIKAGAKAIKTNTFGADSLLSEDFDVIKKIIKAGWDAASFAVQNSDVKIFADIGYILSDEDYISDEYIKIADEFLKLGAENFLFETCDDLIPLLPALSYIREKKPDAFIIVSFAVSQDGYTKKGLYYSNLLKAALNNSGADIAGLNCVCGPSHLYNLLLKLSIDYSKLSVMPNSGYPAKVGGRTVFQDNSKYYSEKLFEIARLGVGVLGGCCGTTPEHIKKSYDLVSGDDFSLIEPLIIKSQNREINKAVNNLKEKLQSGKKVIAVEIDPPMDCDISFLEESAQLVKAAGCDIITIADSPLARTRADSLLTSAYLKRKIGIDVIPHLSCRDKNHIGMKAALMGANINEIDNVLVVTGDPVNISERIEYKGVFSYNSYSLISLINSLNAEMFLERPFTICAALNINSANFQGELKRAEKKIENGAYAFFTQPIFSDESIENLKLASKTLNTKIFAGILPVVSYKNARFLNNEVAGITIPQDIVDSFIDKSPEEAQEITIKNSMNIIDEIYDYCDGFYLMTPLKKINVIGELIKKINAKECNK